MSRPSASTLDATAAAPSPALTMADVSLAPTIPWPALYEGLRPGEQQELLTLAATQGLLYFHQLPPTNSVRAPSEQPRQLPLLEQLLAGHTRGLTAPVRAAITPRDAALDEQQCLAVAKALATPDVCLIRSSAGTGRIRVLAEIIAQAAERDERVLLLARHAASLDIILERLATNNAVSALRCLSRGEAPDRLPSAARAATFTQRVQRLQEQTQHNAQAACREAERRCRHAQHEERHWPRLLELAQRHEQIQVARSALQERRSQLLDDVQRLAQQWIADPAQIPVKDPFGAAFKHTINTHDTKTSRVAALRAANEKQRADSEAVQTARARQIEKLRPHARAKQQKCWWSPTWWRAWFHGDVCGKLAELEKNYAQDVAALAQLHRDLEHLEDQRQGADRRFDMDRAKHCQSEIMRRQRALEGEDGKLTQIQDDLCRQWEQLAGEIERASARPIAVTGAAVEAAHARWLAQQREDDARCSFAHEWARCLHETSEEWASRLPSLVNLVAAPLEALGNAEGPGAAAALQKPFDLLILEDADQVSDAEFLKAARRARRCLLLGEPQTTSRPRAGTNSQATPQRTPPALSCLDRLWEHLRCDTSSLSYRWLLESNRLCCRLRTVPRDQRRCLETECVADFPDIELRILTQPRSRPVLAEVVFPASMAIAPAKEYIFRELEELAIQPLPGDVRWYETEDRVILHFDGPSFAQLMSVQLEPGVREIIVHDPAQNGSSAGWFTQRLEFERANGWQRDRAEAWVERYLGLRDLGRTISLAVPQRITPGPATGLPHSRRLHAGKGA